MKQILTLIAICFSLTILGKGICMDFIVKSERENLYKLYLKKDNTYKYIYSSISLDNRIVLDSGTYEVKDQNITFTSRYTKEENVIANKTYFLKEVKLKSYQSVNTIGTIYCEKKNGSETKVTFLLKNSNDSILISSKKPLDNIRTKVLTPDTSIKQWIGNNILPSYHYKINELDTSNWIRLFSSKNANILAVTNHSDLFGIYYLINDTVYYTNYQRSMEYQQVLIDKCYNEKYISVAQKKELEKSIKNLLTPTLNK